MRTVHVFAIAIAMAGSAALSLPASAERLCKENCVGPLCNKECVHRDRDLTVGRGGHRDVTIEERRRVREPGVEIRRSRPGSRCRDKSVTSSPAQNGRGFFF